MMLTTSAKFSARLGASSPSSTEASAPPRGTRPTLAPACAANGRSATAMARRPSRSSTYTPTAAATAREGTTGGPLCRSTSRPSSSSSMSRTSLGCGSWVVWSTIDTSSAQHRLEGVAERVRAERLGDQEQRAGRLRQLAHLRRTLAGDEPERDADPVGAQLVQQVDAVHLRHVPVREHQVGVLVDDHVQRLGAVGGLDDVVVVVACLAQGAHDDRAHDPTVVGDQDLHDCLISIWSVVTPCW